MSIPAENDIDSQTLQDVQDTLEQIFTDYQRIAPPPASEAALEGLGTLEGLGEHAATLLQSISWLSPMLALAAGRGAARTSEVAAQEELMRAQIFWRVRITTVITVALTLIIAVLGALSSQVLNQPDFGSLADYIALLLFVLGGATLTTLSDVKFSSIGTYLGRPAPPES